MTPEIVGIIGVILLIALIVLGVYIGIAMAVVGLIGFGILAKFSAGLSLLGMIPYSTSSFYTFSIIPLFILMGQLVYHSGFGSDVYRCLEKLLGHLPGGLAMATIIGCAGFSSVCGSSLATAATIGTIAMPEMSSRGYDARLASGSVAVGGTLGILIPPSIGFVIYAILTEVSVGKLFLAGIIPGILLTCMHILTIVCICRRNPNLAPAMQKFDLKPRLLSLVQVWPVLLLFLLVIGGIYLGVFTPVESGAIGACAVLIISLALRRITYNTIIESLKQTLKATSMIFLILIGAEIFTLFLSTSKLPFMLTNSICALSLNRYLILIIILALYLLLGCILEGLAMMVLTIPLFFPLITGLGFDPIWFGVLMVIMLEIGLITPPVGMNIFVIKGIASNIKIETIYAGVIPFIVSTLLVVGLILVYPEIALLIPSRM